MTVALGSDADFVVDLPYPPSVNRLWRATATDAKKVYLAPAYKAWKEEANAALMQKRGWFSRRIKGLFSADIALCPPKGHPRGDLDNRIKAVLDFLQATTVIDNDKNCQLICAYWAPGPEQCRVTIKPWAAQQILTVNDVLNRALQRMEAQ